MLLQSTLTAQNLEDIFVSPAFVTNDTGLPRKILLPRLTEQHLP